MKRLKIRLKLTGEIHCIPVESVSQHARAIIVHASDAYLETRIFILCYSKPLVLLACYYFSSVLVCLPVTVINTGCSQLRRLSSVSVPHRAKSPSFYLETSKKSAEGQNYMGSRCVLWNQQRDRAQARPPCGLMKKKKKNVKDKQKNRCALVLPPSSAVHHVSTSLNTSAALAKGKTNKIKIEKKTQSAAKSCESSEKIKEKESLITFSKL